MSLYDQSAELQLRIEAAQSADAGVDLVASAGGFIDALDSVSDYLEGTAEFRARLSITDTPPVDPKGTSSAISAFRAGYKRYGPKAFQQLPAANLIAVAKEQRARSTRWANARWKGVFDIYQPLIESAQSDLLLGGSRHRYAAEGRAAKLSLLLRQDPITDKDKISAELGAGDATTTWLEQLKSLGDDLIQALQAVKDERDALTSEVRSVLESAASEDGLSLADLTPALLSQLRAAGVDGDLVVRRR